MRIKHFITVGFLWSTMLIFFGYTNAETEGKVNLEIKRGYLTISGSGTTNIGSIISNPSGETRNTSIDSILQIRDQSGLCSGHYTTLQIGDLSNGINTINKQHISINIQIITTLFGTINLGLSVGPTILNQRGNTQSPITHFSRSSGIQCGEIGQYGQTGSLKIEIPANQPSGTYRGKIYYLLVDSN